MRALIAGPGAARTLREGGTGRLEIVLGVGGYVRLGDAGWVLIATPRSVRGPLSLVVAGLGIPGRAGWPASAHEGVLAVGPWRISLAGAEPSGASAACGRANPEALDAALAAAAPPPAGLREGLEALRDGDVAAAVVLLAGRGDGLTPAGDDVLAGYAAWRHAAGSPVTLVGPAAGRASPIGLAYLDCAERGELPDPAAAVLAAVRAGDRAAAARRARALRSWGTTSGAALLWGAAAAARIGAPRHAMGSGTPRSDSGRGPKMRRSVSSMSTSLMLASRRRM
jgi:hypothetical protein